MFMRNTLQIFLFALLVHSGNVFSEYNENRNWWMDLQLSNREYVDSIPTKVLKSLQPHTKDFIPFAQVIRTGIGRRTKAKVVTGDFNCDGKKDYAILGIRSNDAIVKVLTKVEQPASTELDMLRHHYSELMRDSNMVWVGLTEKDNFNWTSYPGTSIGIRGVLEGNLLKAANQDIKNYREKHLKPEGFDFEFIENHRCEVLTIGCCDKPGMDFIWNQRTRKLIKSYLGEC